MANAQRLVIRSLDSESVHQISRIGESNNVPIWSPDGRLIAFQMRQNGSNVIAVVQSDGSGPRVFGDALSATGQSARWSPDSRSIGFLDPARHEFRLLNIATGQIRTVATDTVAQVGVWMWRPDGRSIAAVMTTPGASPGLRSLRRRVDEITVEGGRRPLLDAEAMRDVPGVSFIDPYTIFVRYDTAAFRVPLGGGSPQRLAEFSGAVRPSTGVHATAPTTDLWAGVIPASNSEEGRIEFISARTGERRVVAMPFNPMAGPSPEWTPDGRELIVAGRLLSDTLNVRLYRVPVDGGAPRPIATFAATDGWISVSPDGKSVVYGMIE